MTLISSSRSKEAGIFILLSGRGELVTVSKDSAGNSTAKLQHGAVVGPLDLFNAEKEDPDVSVTYKTTVNAGSVLQLKYMDLFRAKYGTSISLSARLHCRGSFVQQGSLVTME